MADEVVYPEAGQPADQVILARPGQLPAADRFRFLLGATDGEGVFTPDEP